MADRDLKRTVARDDDFDRDAESLSLNGMTPEDALRKALGTKLPESVIKAEEESERDEKKSQKKK